MPSYAFEGPTWRPGPVTWSFASSTYTSDEARYPFSAPLSAAAQATMAQAIQKWAGVSGLMFQQVADTPSPVGAADIRIGFGTLGTPTTHQVGVTNFSYRQYFNPDVVVRLEDPGEDSLVPVNSSLVYGGLGGATLYQVALHEFGHALGLDHSSDPNDVMYPMLTAQNTDLSLSDDAGIRALYPTPSIRLHGPHTDYVIAQVSGGQAYIQDTKAGRDGVQTVAKLGRISFTDGAALFDPTGVAEDVARLYQGAFGRAPDIQGLDDNTALVTSSTIGLAALAASFTASPEFNARYGQTDTTGFARQLYVNVLHRAPDAAGQQLWVNYTNATSRGDALLAFSDSQGNHRQTLPIAGSQSDAEATRLYQAAFNRRPDDAGLALWSGQLHQGVAISQVAQGFVDSREFAEAYGGLDSSGFVTRLYSNVLHRAPDPAGQQGWLSALAGGASRVQVLAGFADSNENRIATAGATHDAWVYTG
jgi:predicted Zn-dependent protease